MSHQENYAALRDVAATVHPDRAIVELGTYYAASAIALAEGAQSGGGAHVWTVDPHDLPGFRTTTGVGRARRVVDYTRPEIRAGAAHAIRAAGMSDHITMVQDFSENAGLAWDGPKVELLYIDGDHREGAVRRDYAAWERHLSRHAAVLFDDYHEWFPGVINTVQRLVGKGLLSEPTFVGTLAICTRK